MRASIIVFVLSYSLALANVMDINSAISWYQPSDGSSATNEPPNNYSPVDQTIQTTTSPPSYPSYQIPSRFEAMQLLKQLKETHPDLFNEYSAIKPEETPQVDYKEVIPKSMPIQAQMQAPMQMPIQVPMQSPMQIPTYYQNQQQQQQAPFYPNPSWSQYSAPFPQMHFPPKRKNFNYANKMNQNQNFNEDDEGTSNLNNYMGGGASYSNMNFMQQPFQMPPIPPPLMMQQLQHMMMNPLKYLAASRMNMPPLYNFDNSYGRSQKSQNQPSQHDEVIPNALEIVRDLLDTVIRGKDESTGDGKESYLKDFF